MCISHIILLIIRRVWAVFWGNIGGGKVAVRLDLFDEERDYPLSDSSTMPILFTRWMVYT